MRTLKKKNLGLAKGEKKLANSKFQNDFAAPNLQENSVKFKAHKKSKNLANSKSKENLKNLAELNPQEILANLNENLGINLNSSDTGIFLDALSEILNENLQILGENLENSQNLPNFEQKNLKFNENLNETLYNLLFKTLQSSDVSEQISRVREFISKTQEIMGKLQSKELGKDELVGYLANLNYSMLGGAVLGAALAMSLNQNKHQIKE